LRNSGLNVALIDKAVFPRDKVCGDAIPGRAIKTLKNIDPVFEDLFKKFRNKCETQKTRLYYRERKITFNWVREAYTCTRMEFDNFLYTLVKTYTGTKIFSNTLPDLFIKNENGFSITIKNSSQVFKTRVLIGADGAQSVVAKQLTNKTIDRDHYVGSVRAYFSNVSNIETNTTEIYFDKKFLPSYLWVFPLPDNTVNVGFGMLSSEIAKQKVNIKKVFYDFIEGMPELKLKFEHARQLGELEGFGLPLGSKTGILSGDSFLITGDAASLIDPISGDGIGNAMLSGLLAARQAARCFEADDFSESFMKQYDDHVTEAIGEELRTHYKGQRILSKVPFLLNLVFLMCKNNRLKQIIQSRL